MWGGFTLPNQQKNQSTSAAVQPGKSEVTQQPTNSVVQAASDALGQTNALAQQATTSVSQAQASLNAAVDALNQQDAATNPQAIKQAQQQLNLAEEHLDQAQTTAIASNQPQAQD
jgi:hypothetical protein